jgi:hypothetical protein
MLALISSLILSLTLAGARGVPQDGYPSWSERTVQMYVNRARADPAADLAGCAQCAEKACYGAKPPMVWDYALNRSARFHCDNLAKTGASLQHNSPCTLVSDIAQKYPPNGTCHGEEACACKPGTLNTCAAGNTCTDPWGRIGLFGGSGNGENAAMGYGDPHSVFYAWLWEGDSDASCGWRYSNGHRANILGDSGTLGVGESSNFFVQDFGYGSPAGSLISGSHEPQGGGGQTEFRANWYDSRGGPGTAWVSVDGDCTALTLERGQPQHGTWLGTAAVSGCHRYAFLFTDSTGGVVRLPEVGTYGVGDPGSCPDYDAAPATACGNPPAPDAGVPPAPDAGVPPAPDAGVPPGPDAGSPQVDAGTPQADAGGGGDDGGTGPGADGGVAHAGGPDRPALSSSGLGCGVPGVGAAALLLALASLLRRRTDP